MPGSVGNLAGVQQSFGGDASDVQTGSTHLVFLDKPNGHTQLAGAQGGGVATASRSEDDKVKGVISHQKAPKLCAGGSCGGRIGRETPAYY